MIETVDRGVGRIVDTLARRNLADNTVVILFSDNGGLSSVTNNAPLREGKQTLYEGGLRVPLIIKWPGTIKKNATCHVPVISDDLLPTVLDMTGGRTSADGPIDGISLVPLLTGEGNFPDRRLYWYYPHYAREPGAVVRDGNYKLIEFYDPPRVELYNLARDLGEQNDLSAMMPDRVDRMQGQIREWLDAVGAIRHAPNPHFDRSRPRGRPQ